MKNVTRRHFLSQAAAASVAMGGALKWSGIMAQEAVRATTANAGRFGPLQPDPRDFLDLPAGFTYRIISETGHRMSDGLLTPGRPDGMATFPGETPGTCIVVRNHEIGGDAGGLSPFEETGGAAPGYSPDQFYDLDQDGNPHPGGTTTFVYDLGTEQIVSSHLSLCGTIINCAGGTTPWGSWLSCEETVAGPDDPRFQKAHGFVFEVPSTGRGLADPKPLTGMGRFVHEAAAVDPSTGAVYMTDDDYEGPLFRFLPDQPGKLAQGGRLQVLTFMEDLPADARNFQTEWGGAGPGTMPRGRPVPVRWIDVQDPLAREADIRVVEAANGAVKFARGEGIIFTMMNGVREVYFACTAGGPVAAGQIFKYRPSRFEGTPAEAGEPPTVELSYESPGREVFDLVDNIQAAPWGELLLCEDGTEGNFLRVLTKNGGIADFARNVHPRNGEFAGACFSPDGSTLFVNIQDPGFTLAISGPWPSS